MTDPTAELHAILPDHDALADELAGIHLPLAEYLRSADLAGVRALEGHLTAAMYQDLERVKEATKGLQAALETASRGDAWELVKERLLLSGATPFPAALSVLGEVEAAPAVVREVARTDPRHALRMCLLAAGSEAAARRARGLRSSLFSEALEDDLGTLQATIEAVLETTGEPARGAPPDTGRRAIAQSAANAFRRFGLTPTTTRGGTFDRAVRVLVAEAGETDLRDLLGYAVKASV